MPTEHLSFIMGIWETVKESGGVIGMTEVLVTGNIFVQVFLKYIFDLVEIVFLIMIYRLLKKKCG